MTSPDPRQPDGSQRPADHAQRPDDGSQSSRRDAGPDVPVDRYVHPEAALGGADAVEKTSYVVGSGTEPHAQRRADTVAHPPASGEGINLTAWIVGAVVALIVIVYLLGLMR